MKLKIWDRWNFIDRQDKCYLIPTVSIDVNKFHKYLALEFQFMYWKLGFQINIE